MLLYHYHRDAYKVYMCDILTGDHTLYCIYIFLCILKFFYLRSRSMKVKQRLYCIHILFWYHWNNIYTFSSMKHHWWSQMTSVCILPKKIIMSVKNESLYQIISCHWPQVCQWWLHTVLHSILLYRLYMVSWTEL